MHTDGLLGHAALLDRLSSAVDRESLHHALLFEGPPGVGKNTVAMHLARAANCVDDDLAARPCGRCRPCTTIAAGNHPDIIVLTPESSSASGLISIKRIREVVRQAQYHRYGARRRFIIIDPIEALAPAAANALLKTLEEPPDGTGFILIATNARALLPTIVSRCQRVRFGPVSTAELQEWLHGRGASDVEAIAAAALGCPGVAIRLEQGELKTRNQARDALITVLEGDLASLFTFDQKLCSGSRAAYRVKMERLFELLEELLRDAALRATGSTSSPVHADCTEVTARWSTALWPDGVAKCQQALVDVRIDMERNVSGRTAMDALLCTVREELGVPERAAKR